MSKFKLCMFLVLKTKIAKFDGILTSNRKLRPLLSRNTEYFDTSTTVRILQIVHYFLVDFQCANSKKWDFWGSKIQTFSEKACPSEIAALPRTYSFPTLKNIFRRPRV